MESDVALACLVVGSLVDMFSERSVVVPCSRLTFRFNTVVMIRRANIGLSVGGIRQGVAEP